MKNVFRLKSAKRGVSAYPIRWIIQTPKAVFKRTSRIRMLLMARGIFWRFVPTLKAGICHVEAPATLLEKMLTVRIHLDAMGPHNGPIVVRKGSHLEGKLLHSQVPAANEITQVHCQAGSVMLMRPLVSHSSIASLPGLSLHRRTIHLELSAIETLPYGFRWHTYLPVGNRQP